MIWNWSGAGWVAREGGSLFAKGGYKKVVNLTCTYNAERLCLVVAEPAVTWRMFRRRQ